MKTLTNTFGLIYKKSTQKFFYNHLRACGNRNDDIVDGLRLIREEEKEKERITTLIKKTKKNVIGYSFGEYGCLATLSEKGREKISGESFEVQIAIRRKLSEYSVVMDAC